MIDYGFDCGFAPGSRLVVAGAFDGTMSFTSKIIQANGFSSGFGAALAVP